VTVETRINGEAFLTPRGSFTEVVATAVRAVTGLEPEMSTTGGTSDARFIRALCPVVEFGLVGTTMHKVNECAPIAEIHALSAIYEHLIEGYFRTLA
jgi:succinyl-diaminopimelate desuccinylase